MDCTMCHKPIPEDSKYRKTCSDNCHRGRWLLKTVEGSVRHFSKWAEANKTDPLVLDAISELNKFTAKVLD